MTMKPRFNMTMKVRKVYLNLIILLVLCAHTLMASPVSSLASRNAAEKVTSKDTLNVKNVEAILYSNKTQNQPLMVGLGGSEGGNAWATEFWKTKRDQFIEQGYAFLAIGYFGLKSTPAILNKIAIEDVYNAIAEAKKLPYINSDRIYIIGGSRGADLALLLASYYKDIRGVIGMSSSHAVFPGHTQEFTTSCFTWEGKELDFVPVNEAAVPFLMEGNLRKVFEAMLMDSVAEKKALIPVEKIQGPILLLSGNADEIIPSAAMSEKMIQRLKSFNFKFPYQHLALEGNHAEPTKRFDLIFEFMKKNF